MGSRFVQHDDCGILEQQPCDRDPLLLAAGHAMSAVADDGVHSAGSRHRRCGRYGC